MLKDKLLKVYARDREEWRTWLSKNHELKKSVWLVYYKKESGKKSITYTEAVEEALCFGWIDSKPNKIDEKSYMQLFSQRKKKSVWSKINKERVVRLIQQNLMTVAGMEKVNEAKKNGSWDSLNEVEEMIFPEDFKKAMNKNKLAKKYFDAFSNSSKKMILYWIHSAKRPETRSKRIEESVKLASQNIKANHYKQ